ncbi:hypothetical protein BH24ACI2_BH24ACI2_02530 [soil metagenome]
MEIAIIIFFLAILSGITLLFLMILFSYSKREKESKR